MPIVPPFYPDSERELNREERKERKGGAKGDRTFNFQRPTLNVEGRAELQLEWEISADQNTPG